MNTGLHPIDKDSLVGKLRLSLGDTAFTELPDTPTPLPEVRAVAYANFSDDALEQLLADAGESILRAKAYAYGELAAIAAHRAVIIKTNDLGVTKTSTAKELAGLARFWSEEADKADEIALDESFEIVRYPGRDNSDPAIPFLL